MKIHQRAERGCISVQFICLSWKDSEAADRDKMLVYYLHICVKAEACQIQNILPDYTL